MDQLCHYLGGFSLGRGHLLPENLDIKRGAPAEGLKALGPLAGGPGSRVPRVPSPLGPGGLNHNGLLF